MLITLTQQEVETAIVKHVKDLFYSASAVKDIAIDFKVERNPQTITATVNLDTEQVSSNADSLPISLPKKLPTTVSIKVTANTSDIEGNIPEEVIESNEQEIISEPEEVTQETEEVVEEKPSLFGSNKKEDVPVKSDKPSLFGNLKKPING